MLEEIKVSKSVEASTLAALGNFDIYVLVEIIDLKGCLISAMDPSLVICPIKMTGVAAKWSHNFST